MVGPNGRDVVPLEVSRPACPWPAIPPGENSSTMKNIIIILFCLISFNAFSATTEVDVISAEFGVEDYTHRKSLCLTVVRIPKSGSLLGIVESLEDCFYARTAKKNNTIHLAIKKLQKIDGPKMLKHLQSIDTQLEFYFSDGE